MLGSVDHSVASTLPLMFLALYSSSLDPFQLIPCRSFGEDVQVCCHNSFILRFCDETVSKCFFCAAFSQEPFQVIVCAETLIIMDMVCQLFTQFDLLSCECGVKVPVTS